MELSKVRAVPFMQIPALLKGSEAGELLPGHLVSIWLFDNKMGKKAGWEKLALIFNSVQ